MYYGYYRESAKYKTEWICFCKSEDRKEVAQRIRFEKIKHPKDLGARYKIVKKD